MSLSRKTVLAAAIGLFAVWFIANSPRIVGDDDGFIRFVLGALFAILILLRQKSSEAEIVLPRWTVPALLIAGTVFALAGIILRVNMVEWVGILFILFSAVIWVSPSRYTHDVIVAFVLLFCVHPLPGQIFTSVQHMMQVLSVWGSEIVLHWSNVRVWADGLTLRTGYLNFMVPEICSGMRTAVTVLLCTLGVGMLLRLKWYEVVVFAFLGLIQVLALNITRIVHMVLWAPRMPPEWAENYLHDSVAIFLLGAIVLVQIEVSWWKVWSRRRKRLKHGIETGELEPPERASIIPGRLRRLLTVGTILSVVAVIGFSAFAMFYKSRRYHKVEMIKPVIEALMHSNVLAAERAIGVLLKQDADDRELLVMRVRLCLMKGEFDKALDVLDELENMEDGLSLHETILKGWALMRQGHAAEAISLVNALPESADQLPGVAMIKAEFAAAEDKPVEAALNTVLAARSHMMVSRVRDMFPYLARREQWQAISDSDHDIPYNDVRCALIAVQANMRVGNIAGTARTLKHALKSWPNDRRFLHSLFAVARWWREGDWENIYADCLKANLMEFSADDLAIMMNQCWRLGRVDLAWALYKRLAVVDKNDPSLHLVPAQRSRQWFSVRTHDVGVQSEDKEARISLATLCRETQRIEPFSSLWQKVPLGEELAWAYMTVSRDRHIALCLDELDRRTESGDLTRRLEWMYPSALALAGRYPEAHTRLDEILDHYPEMKPEVLLQHAVFYDQKQKWQDSYESVFEYNQEKYLPNLTAQLMQVGALINMNVGVAAMDVVDKARLLFPGTVRLDLAEAAIWDVFGYKEQALFLLSKTKGGSDSPIAIQLLYDTGRFREAKELSEATGVGIIRRGKVLKQSFGLRPAQWAVARRWPELTEANIAKMLKPLDNLLKEASSPYMLSLLKLTQDWLHAQGKEDTSDIGKWEVIGRNDRETVGALYRLATLLARNQQYSGAVSTIRRSLEILPKSPVLWRALVSMTEGNNEDVKAAYNICPDDPNIWLGWLVANAKSHEDWKWAKNEINQVIDTRRFSSGTLTRAGRFFYEKKQLDIAGILAKAAIPRSRGLIPAYWLGLVTGIRTKDFGWALSCAIGGVENAEDPTPFFKAIVEIKAMGKTYDSDMLAALEYLTENQREEPQWAVTLGRAYFQKGDMQRALTIFDSVVREDSGNLRPQTLLLAAEAARLEGKPWQAVRILESAYELYPERVSVLNNLVYVLALDKRTLTRARKLLPKLISIGNESFEVMDTVAMVYIRTGELESARKHMDAALGGLDRVSYSPQEMRLNAAELQVRLGKHEEAKQQLELLRQDAERSDFIDMKASKMLRDINGL